MIIVYLEGGLGNQLFQYACGRALALRTGHELVLDHSRIDPRNPIAPRVYGLAVFQLAARLVQPTDPRPVRPTWRTRLRARLGFGRGAELLQEQGARFQAERFPTRFDCLGLQGYWQSEKYFADFQEQIRRELSLRPEHARRLDPHLLGQVERTNSVALHIRRGDYVSDPTTRRILGACPLDYYRRSADHMASQVDRPAFFIFSDDPAWVQQNLKLEHPTHIVSDGQRQDYEELALMQHCKHNIIANSSFSWWGAWMNARADKIVCAPRRWFASADYDSSDLLPAAWTQL